MPTYNALTSDVAKLHIRTVPLSMPAAAVPGDWIPTAVDNSSASVGNEFVVICFGANYATGVGKMPSIATARSRRSFPWVEENLNGWRSRVEKHIEACAAGKTIPHWNGLLPYDTTNPSIATNCWGRMQQTKYHLLMSNLSPWITTKDWSVIRDARLEDIFDLASRFDSPSGFWGYFKALKKCAGRNSIWVGHGNAEIYGIFLLLCWKLEIKNWFFTSNLSQKNWFL